MIKNGKNWKKCDFEQKMRFFYNERKCHFLDERRLLYEIICDIMRERPFFRYFESFFDDLWSFYERFGVIFSHFLGHF